MADMRSFATGFVKQLNVEQEEKRKARREHEALVNQSLAAAKIKQWQTDMDSYTTNSAARKKAEALVSANDITGVAQMMSTVNGKFDEDLYAQNLSRLRMAYGIGDEKGRASASAIVDQAYQVGDTPDINSAKYQAGYQAMRQQLMAQAPDDQHIFLKAFGIPSNRHKRDLKAMNNNTYEPAAREDKTAMLFGEGAKFPTQVSELDPKSPEAKVLNDLDAAEQALSSSPEDTQLQRRVDRLQARAELIGWEKVQDTDETGATTTYWINPKTGERKEAAVKAPKVPTPTPTPEAIVEDASTFILNKIEQEEGEAGKILADMSAGSDAELTEAATFINAVSSRANYLRINKKMGQTEAVEQAYKELSPGLQRTETGLGAFIKDAVPEKLWRWIGTETKFERPTGEAPTATPAAPTTEAPVAPAPKRTRKKTMEEVLFSYKDTPKWEAAKAQYLKKTGKSLPVWATE